MVRALTDFLTAEGYRVRHEVPNMGQSADIVAERGSGLTFIEAKLANWRVALKQCRAHHHVADYICVAVAGKKPSPSLLAAAEQLGYGIIHFDLREWCYSWVRSPEKNLHLWPPQRQQLNQALDRIDYAD